MAPTATTAVATSKTGKSAMTEVGRTVPCSGTGLTFHWMGTPIANNTVTRPLLGWARKAWRKLPSTPCVGRIGPNVTTRRVSATTPVASPTAAGAIAEEARRATARSSAIPMVPMDGMNGTGRCPLKPFVTEAPHEGVAWDQYPVERSTTLRKGSPRT